MTTGPGSDFSYSDDSVVARISVEVPGQAASDINAITSATSALRTEMEALGRAEGDHLGYIAQLPQFAEQANQAYRSLITSMERMSYIQREMGGMPNVGVNGPMATGGGYSTAAPQGYADPFQGMTSGMRGGVPQNMAQAQAYMANMQANNPQLFANMMAQRGINPAQFGPAGSVVYPNTPGSDVGGTGGGQGQGAPPPASASPQPTQSSRRAAAPPDPGSGGAPLGSDSPEDTPEPHPDAPGWQHAAYAMKNGARQALNELAASGGRLGGMAGMAQRAMSVGGSVMGRMGGGDTAAGGGSRLASIGKGLGVAGGALAIGTGINDLVQRGGQEITRYSQLGSVQGGGAVEGFGYEMQARIMGMNPFITTDQSRQIMQMALKEGFRGGQFDTVQQFMAKNFKDMGMDFSQSMDLVQSALKSSNATGKDFNSTMKDMSSTLGEMKGLSKKGGASLPSRTAQMQNMVDALGNVNVSSEAASNASLSMQEMFPQNRQLAQNVGEAAGQAWQNPTFQLMMGQQFGVSGFPGAIPGELEDMGVNSSEAFMDFARKQAQGIAQRIKNPRQAAELFRMQMQAYGVNLSQSDAYQLYKQLIGGKDPVDTARRSREEGGRQTLGEQMGGLGDAGKGLMEQVFGGARIAGGIEKMTQGDIWGGLGEALNPMPAITGVADAIGSLFDDNNGPTAPKPGGGGGRRAGERPAQQAASPFSAPSSEGKVSGEVRITVDQQGRVSAPQSIQLTGNQRQVNAGYGSQTLNGPSPGDPNYNHAYSNWSGG
jgi:hypothetical protein